MGLLVLVAAAGRRGITRDRVLGILWPEADQEQARHTLSQTLYGLKRDTGRDWIVALPDLRLDSAITSDVSELQDALSAGDHATVAALYAGVFLDGFYIPGAPEFERWVETERAHLQRAATRAAEHLATEADQRRDLSGAIRWWNRLTELDPLSERFAAGRMRALAAAGDRASALAHARSHEEVVRRELDADADPAIGHLVRALKAEPSPVPAFPNLTPAAAAPTSQLPPVPEPPVKEATLPGPAPVIRTGRIATFLLVVVALSALAAFLFRPSRPAQAPFLAVGAIRTPEMGDTSSLGPVLRDMLATSFGGLGGLQVVANSRLVELTPPAGENLPGATEDAARRAGATEVIEGELVTEAGGLVLTLRRVDLSRGVVRKGYVVRAGNRYALVDSAAAALARDLGLTPPSLGVRDARTASPEAYALYNEGLRAYYSYDAPAAYRLMTAALERDSSFAMAAYYAWQLSRSLADAPTTQSAFERAKRLAPRTIERERLLIQAATASLNAPVAVAAAIAETLTVRYPSEPDGQILLGEVRRSQGDWSASVGAFERAVAIDSAAGAMTGPYCRMCLALGLMSHTYLWWDSAAAAERVARRMLALRPDELQGWNNVVEPLLRQGRRAEAEQALESSGPVGNAASLSNPVLHRDLIRWGRLEELDRKLLAELSLPSREIRGDARWLLLLSLRDQGRFREGLSLARDGRPPGSLRVVPGLGPDPMFSAILLVEMGRPDSGAKLLHGEARRILSSTQMPPGFQARVSTWHLSLAGSAYVAAGDTAVARRVADSIEVLGRGSIFGRDLRLHHFLKGLLFQQSGRHLDAVEEFRRSLFSLTDGYTRANLALARSLLLLNRPAEAIAVLRPAIHGGVDGSNSYTSRTELHEAMAQAFEQAGQRDSSMAHYQAVEQAWRHADPQFLERYRRAKARATGVN